MTIPTADGDTRTAAGLPAQLRAEPAAPESPGASNSRLARAALLTAVLSAAGSILGLGRDQSLAHLFGAGSETDAFLVAWTVPEFASTLLIEDGLAFVLVPAFSAAIARRAQAGGTDPVRSLVSSSLPRFGLAFLAATVLLIAGAPFLVHVLAPGLPDPQLAVDCTRLTATCVLTFGLAGYCSAALRAHGCYLPPAAIYVAYNIGIIATMLVCGTRLGVRSAAMGVAVGGCLMVAVQLPAFQRRLNTAKAGENLADEPGGETAAKVRAMHLGLIAAVLAFALCKQSQVFIERFLASSLAAGSISHLNYAQKVAQLPMSFSLMLCTVTFPVVAQAVARGDVAAARARIERDLGLAACVVLVGAAAIFACAPQIIQVLFQRGAFTAADTAATASVMRVYALGLLGHSMVGALVRSYFSAGRPTWYPVGAMAVGMAATAGVGARTVDLWGVRGIAGANAFGITLTAVLLLAGMDRRSVPVDVSKVLAEMGKPLLAAAGATVAGLMAAASFTSPLAAGGAGCLAVAAVFVVLLWALRAESLAPLVPVVRSATRKLRHAR
ncbi:murein biosynthesis integral membrane protein MurJ [Streptomyces sp. NBC_01445]|uniref:murein biosynthesis integral membrane protein MurJ n=1 Tax=Streptomyces sp. NBC_01445 TaxID=2903869 RepID=UPI002DD81CBE|nr:lipid II flippase MurJ [Streptomyces sp. NBC_01445]WSE06010.1 murein biosynthesis protein MurJ [Streptomyces sp. NBC_01445]